MNNETDETKEAFEAFEVYLDLDAQLKGAEAEVLRLKRLQLVQKRAIGDALGIFEGEYVFTSSDGSALIVEIDEYEVTGLRVAEKLSSILSP